MSLIVDKEDWNRVSQWKWSSQGHYLRINRHNRNIYLHHFLIGMPIDRSLQVDHINRNKLDNRKENLRFVTPQENALNKKTAKGCYWDKDRGFWVSQIMLEKQTYLGSFTSENEAHQRYLEANEVRKALKEKK